MEPIYRARLSMLTNRLLSLFYQSLPPAGSLGCQSCGLSFSGRGRVGMSGFRYEIDCCPPNSSHFRLVLAVTDDGNCSILCACSPSVADASARSSGAHAGISSTAESSASVVTRETGRRATIEDLAWIAAGMWPVSGGYNCGCDPNAHHWCERHLDFKSRFITDVAQFLNVETVTGTAIVK